MIIKDFYIEKGLDYIIINDIIKFLIKNEINYLYIKESKELHFDNYILKFKENKIELDEIYNNFFQIVNSFYNYYDSLNFKDYYDINFTYKKNNFKNIKHINNLKINNKPKIKTLKKQMNPTRKIYK